MSKYSYRNAGVDIDQANQMKKAMAIDLVDNFGTEVINKPGAFASLIRVNFRKYSSPILVMKTEEPGSKQKLAINNGKIESICEDMVNHLINDCIVMGAHPLSVQDAIICGELDDEIVLRMVKAMASTCKKHGCSLTGGETSVQPGVLGKDEYILTSSIVGVVEEQEIIDGSGVEVDDVVIAISSNGAHTNGYTLIRKLLDEDKELANKNVDGLTFLDSALLPHLCYYECLKDLFKLKVIHGLAHITGGGIADNLSRVLPKNIDAVINLDQISVPKLFSVIRTSGEIEDSEMLKTFNMGVGMALICNRRDAESILRHINTKGFNAYHIGTTKPGNEVVNFLGELGY